MNTARLYAEIRGQGFCGSAQVVRRYLRRFQGTSSSTRQPTQLSVRQVTGWIMQEPTNLAADDQKRLRKALDPCTELKALARHVRGFTEIIRGDLLNPGWMTFRWMEDFQADGLPDLHTFTAGRRRDCDAVVARPHDAVELRTSRRTRQLGSRCSSVRCSAA